jgi:hypothetical protein
VRNLPGFSSTPARITAVFCFAALKRAGNSKSHENDCAECRTQQPVQVRSPVESDRGGPTRRHALGAAIAAVPEATAAVCLRTVVCCCQTRTILADLIWPQLVHHDQAADDFLDFLGDHPAQIILGQPSAPAFPLPCRRGLGSLKERTCLTLNRLATWYSAKTRMTARRLPAPCDPECCAARI